MPFNETCRAYLMNTALVMDRIAEQFIQDNDEIQNPNTYPERMKYLLATNIIEFQNMKLRLDDDIKYCKSNE